MLSFFNDKDKHTAGSTRVPLRPLIILIYSQLYIEISLCSQFVKFLHSSP